MRAIVVPAGTRFGSWTVIGEAPKDKHGKRMLLCRCSCGATKPVSLKNLRAGVSSNCGCEWAKYPTAKGEDITGQVFGRLTVISRAEDRGRDPYWNCRCSCGVERQIREYALIDGDTKSCGCLKVDTRRELSRTHGMSHAPVYSVFIEMLARCKNPNNASYHGYGGRGVKVCDRWDPDKGGSFENFLADMGEPKPGMSLDKDLKGGIGCLLYSPENCTWLSKVEQARYRRNNRMITHKGVTLCLSQWARITEVPRSLLKDRLNRGWDFESAVKTPPAL